MIYNGISPRRESAEGPPKPPNAKYKYYLVNNQVIIKNKNKTLQVTIYNDYR